MNRLQLQTTLASATISTFESLALLCECGGPEAAPAEGAAPVAGLSGVRLDFAGPLHGTLVLRASGDALAAAAANMLALDAPPTEALCRDALGELANVACGNLLPALAGRQAVFTLAAPRWIGAGDDGLAAPTATAALTLDAGRVEAALHLPAGATEAIEAA